MLYISSVQLKTVKQLKRLSSILFLPPIFGSINMSSSVTMSDNLVKKFSEKITTIQKKRRTRTNVKKI